MRRRTPGEVRLEEVPLVFVGYGTHVPERDGSPDWDLSGMIRDAQLIHAVAERLGNSEAWPNWAEGGEFKALRDASAGERE